MQRIIQSFLLVSFFMTIKFTTGCDQENGTRLTEKTSSDIEIVSHRGANRLAPENTYASALKAIESGADYVEFDVRRSKDGVHYIIHDRTLDRTTNGTGLVSQASSEYIDGLDAGSWFGHEFSGEVVPRLYEYLKWIKGKAKVYFDIKDGDLQEIFGMVYELGFEDDSFFWFGDRAMAREFRSLDPDLSLKINASEIEHLDSLISIYNPDIIERGIVGLTDDFITACHERGLKLMIYVPGDDWDGYFQAMSMNIDMINLDNPDVFTNMVENDGVFTDYRLIAHRGGITEDKFNEFDPASINKAIDQGYFMLEVDIRMTKDSVLIVHHDSDFQRFFNHPGRVDEMTWEQIQDLRSDRGDYHPMSFEQLARMVSGRVKLMMDLKAHDSDPCYFRKLGEIMERYDLFDGAYFIDGDARNYYWGRSKFGFGMSEIPRIQELISQGEDVVCHYFLFDTSTRLTSEAVKWAQHNFITVVAAVNIFRYRYENHWQGAKRDIEFLKACGVREFQIDSHYDQWLPVTN